MSKRGGAMRRSFRAHRTQAAILLAAHRAVLALLLATLLLGRVQFASAAPPAGGTATGWKQAQTTNFAIYMQGDDQDEVNNFAIAQGGDLETAVDELRL